MTRFFSVVALAGIGAGIGIGVPVGSAQAQSRSPVVVELYQSQGCSSCPPANAAVNAIADRPDVLALSFAVTYWDNLGWKDTFATPAYTQRQWDYARAGGRSQVATPQVVINGDRTTIVGGNRQQLAERIRQAQHSGGPAITASGGKVTIGRGATSTPATVWLVRYDPREQDIAVRAGENGGRTLPHRNIVRLLQRIGTWNGTPVTLNLPANGNPAFRTAVLVQRAKGGPIAAAAKL